MAEDFKPELKPVDLGSGAGPAPVGEMDPVPGFWLRLGSFVIDVALLTMLCYYAGRHGFEALYPLRDFTQLLGALGAFVYFAAGDSRLTGGQTTGRWVMQIRVADERAAGDKPFGLPLGRAATRSLITQVYVFAYMALIAPVFCAAAAMLAGARLTISLSYPESHAAVLVLSALGFVAAAYTFGVSVFIGLAPRKQAPHDKWLGAAVVRAGEERKGLEFTRTVGEHDRARTKLAAWPAVCLAVIFLFLGGTLVVQNSGEASRRVFERLREARGILDQAAPSTHQSFRLADVSEPSVEKAAMFEKAVAREQQRRAMEKEAPLTSETLKLAPNGRKFHFLFLARDARITSETVAALPEYQALEKAMPGVAAALARGASAKKPMVYDAVQAEVFAFLPMYLYTEQRFVRAQTLEK